MNLDLKALECRSRVEPSVTARWKVIAVITVGEHNVSVTSRCCLIVVINAKTGILAKHLQSRRIS